MKKLLVLSAALLTVGCVPRVPVRFTPKVSTVVPKIKPVTMPKPLVSTPKLPHHLTMPIETQPLVRPTSGSAAKDKGHSILDQLGDLPLDDLFGGKDDTDKDRKKTPASPKLPR